MELTEELKRVFIDTAMTLKGYARRRFMAQTVKAFGAGGARIGMESRRHSQRYARTGERFTVHRGHEPTTP